MLHYFYFSFSSASTIYSFSGQRQHLHFSFSTNINIHSYLYLNYFISFRFIRECKGPSEYSERHRACVCVCYLTPTGSPRGSSNRTVCPGRIVAPGWRWAERLWTGPCRAGPASVESRSEIYSLLILSLSEPLHQPDKHTHTQIEWTDCAISTTDFLFITPAVCCKNRRLNIVLASVH